MANRHLSRIIVMQSLFEWDFRQDSDIYQIAQRNITAFQEECDKVYIDLTLNGIRDNLLEIDKIVAAAAPEWPIEQIASIDKSILRVAVYELLFNTEVPPKVVINEAVELGKIYGSENSSKFINGVLGTLFKQDPRYEETIKEEPTLLDLSN